MALNIIDDQVMGYFDSKTNRFESRQSWMAGALGQGYDETETNTLRGVAASFKNNVRIAMERFNSTQGNNILHTHARKNIVFVIVCAITLAIGY